MALTKQDKDWIELTIQNALNAVLAPTIKKVDEHDQTLYGIGRTNGLRSTVNGLVQFKWIITGGVMLGAAILGTFQFILR